MVAKKIKKSKRSERLSKGQPLSIKQKVSIYDKWIVLLCAAILIAVPFAVSFISYDQFDIVKLAVLRLLVAGMVIVWAVKNWRKSEPFVFSWREGLLASFLILLVLSTLQSIHVLTSVYGKYQRYEGLLTFITYITMYFVAMQVFKNRSQLRLIIEVTSIAGGVVAFYGILQYFGLDIIKWTDNRIFSTLGNADTLAGYLVLAFPCAIGAYFNINKRRFLHGFMALLIIACLYASFTRSGWIGAFVALLCLMVLLGRKVLKNRLREIAILSAPLLIILVSLIVYSSSHSKNFNLMSRSTSMFNLNKGATIERVLMWKSGLKMIEDKPFLGQGPDTFRLASERFQTKREVRLSNGKQVTDNAHNYFIQLASTTGPLAAVLIYAFFITWIIRSIGVRRKISDDNEDHILISSVIAAVAGYLVVMISGISVVGEAAVFWLLLASVAGYTHHIKPVYAKKQTSKWPHGLRIGLITSLVVITTVNAGIAATMYAGDIYFNEGLKASSVNDIELASANFDKAAALYPSNGRIMSEKGLMYQRLTEMAINTKDQEAYDQFSQEAILAFVKAIQAEPLEETYKIYLAGTYGTTGLIDDAKTTLNSALSRFPYYPAAHVLYGQLEQAQNHNKEALKHYEKAIDLAPDRAFPDIYLRMADLYRKTGNTKKADVFEAAGTISRLAGNKKAD